MKTNRFEEILRRKLESLKPDFQTKDWDRFQAFQPPAAPSFWQTYGHWLGYAVAVVTTGIMVTLYVNQSRQNDALLREMKELRAQIKSGTDGPPRGRSAGAGSPVVTNEFEATGGPPVPHFDTIYVIDPRLVYRDRPVYKNKAAKVELAESTDTESPSRLEVDFKLQKSENLEIPVVRNDVEGNDVEDEAMEVSPLAANENNSQQATQGIIDNKSQAALRQAIQPQDRVVLDDVRPLPAPSQPKPGSIEYRRLTNRMPTEVRKPETPMVARSEKIAENKAAPTKPAIQGSVEQVIKEESLLPKFGLNLPFRVGVGQQWEGRTKAFSLWNEVLLGKHWSVQAGLSWQKLEDQKFFDERLFKVKMREEFRNKHAPKLPPNFDIFNITARTKIVRIPLNLTYRNEISKEFSYFVGAGTNLNVQARQTLSFDYKRPSRDFGQETKERTIPFPLINNVNALVGVEKRWSPIVLQVSSFLNTRFRTFPFLEDRTDVGLQVKLLYEFKAKKKE